MLAIRPVNHSPSDDVDPPDCASPLASVGGKCAVMEVLNASFPDTTFRLSDDGVGVFVKYIHNAPGAPSREQVLAVLQPRFPGTVWKIPKLIQSSLDG